MLFSKILVAYDGSALGKEALNKTIEIAKQNERIEIEVVHVVTLSSLGMAYEGINIPELVESSMRQVKEIVGPAEEALSKITNHWRTVILEGQPAPKILDHAEQNGCDLIVMGSRGLTGLKELFLGSVSHNVVQHSSVPVFIIK